MRYDPTIVAVGTLAALLAAVLAALLVAVPSSLIADTKRILMRPFLSPAYLGSGGAATDLLLCYPMGLAIDGEGRLLISDRGRSRRGRVIWQLDHDGRAHALAGSGEVGKAAEGSAAEVGFKKPEGLTPAPDGGVYLADAFNHVVVHISRTGLVTRVAGSGKPGYSGDGGPAVDALLDRPADVRVDHRGNLYISDVRNHRIRRIEPGGTISTVAGTGRQGFSPDGTLAIEASLSNPWGIALDSAGRLLIADSDNHRVRRIEHSGRLTTLAGSGRRGFDGDGAPAVDAALDSPQGLFVDVHGQIFIGDEHNNAVRLVDRRGNIQTLMGTGSPGRAREGARARGAPLNDPENIIVRDTGEIIITDGNNGRVLQISRDGTIATIAGHGDLDSCSSRF